MRRQSRVSASRAALLVSRNQPQVTFYLVQRVSMPAQPLLSLARDCSVVRAGQQPIQTWWEHLWPNPRTQERLRLHAFADKEHAVTLRALLNVVGCPHGSSLQREATLCQR
jgi:hypothetical protein